MGLFLKKSFLPPPATPKQLQRLLTIQPASDILAGLLGEAKINIATFHLGRTAQGGDAIALVEIDGVVPADVLAKVQALPQVKQAKLLAF